MQQAGRRPDLSLDSRSRFKNERCNQRSQSFNVPMPSRAIYAIEQPGFFWALNMSRLMPPQGLRKTGPAVW